MSDRGMKKYLPFSSLVEHGKYLKKVVYEKNKEPKPELTSDEEEKINRILINFKSDVVYYFKLYLDGYIYYVKSKILSVDKENKTIIFEDLTIKFEDVLDITSNDDPFDEIC